VPRPEIGTPDAYNGRASTLPSTAIVKSLPKELELTFLGAKVVSLGSRRRGHLVVVGEYARLG